MQAQRAQQAAIAAAQASARNEPQEFGKDYMGLVEWAYSKFGDIGVGPVTESIDAIDAGNDKNWQEAYSAWNSQYGVHLVRNKIETQARVKQYFQETYSFNVPKPEDTTGCPTGLQPSRPGQYVPGLG
jgi:hypothetical protein